MKRLTLTFVLLSFALPALAAPRAAAPGDPRTAPATQRLHVLVERVKTEQKKLTTLEARFVQLQESSLLAAPEKATGHFSYSAPDKVRWEYEAPNPISVVIRGEEMTTWYHDLQRADLIKIGRYSNQVFKYLGASGNMQTLLEYFDVRLGTSSKQGEPYRMELTPRFQRIAKRLKSMTLWIDDATFLPVRLRYVEADGDTTEYRFEDLKRNGRIPEDRYVLQLPKGVQTRVVDLGHESKSKP
ncbi:MAG TPA: outer membrane lipoprotein carrier protein LolA [Thermoanaerobaculia bacterium]|nr:outer membrane lipoprotein carrier protein LolA [Thermoanaerobaculia bacterium]